MSLATRITKLAQTGITKYGKTVTYTAIVQGVYDPATSSLSSTTSVFDVKTTVEDWTDRGQEGQVSIGEKKITIPALSMPVPPTRQDSVLIDGLNYTVFDFDTIYALELTALYVIHGKQA
jgi:hypothetical protein